MSKQPTTLDMSKLNGSKTSGGKKDNSTEISNSSEGPMHSGTTSGVPSPNSPTHRSTNHTEQVLLSRPRQLSYSTEDNNGRPPHNNDVRRHILSRATSTESRGSSGSFDGLSPGAYHETSLTAPLIRGSGSDASDEGSEDEWGESVIFSRGGVKYDESNEKTWHVAVQVFFPYIIAGLGMVAAGMVLDTVKHWDVFVEVSEVFILVPALLGLKGNLEMTLASRLSTQKA